MAHTLEQGSSDRKWFSSWSTLETIINNSVGLMPILSCVSVIHADVKVAPTLFHRSQSWIKSAFGSIECWD